MSDDHRVRRVVITSNVRYAPVGETGGYFRVLDLERGRVSFVAMVPESLYREVDPNPRGGERGGRGVSAHGDRLVIGNAERIFVFDPTWKLLEDVTHPFMANIHDVHAEERGVWVAATGCDALLLVGWDGQLLDRWTFQDDERLVEDLGLPPGLPRFDPTQDYRDPRLRGRRYTIHINAISRGSGGLLVGFGRIHSYFEPDGGESAIIALEDGAASLSAASASIVDRRPAPGVPNHNVAEDGDLLVFNDSNRGCLVAHDRRLREDRCAVPIPGNPSFVRGLAKVAPSLWLVGSQAPLAVYAVDLDRGEVVADYPLGGVENETVYAIGPIPDTFDDPSHPDSDPYAFWRRAAPGKGMSPIPSRGGPRAPGRA